MTEVFGMGNGLRAYVRARLVDYATARWLLLGAVPMVVLGAIAADLISPRLLKAIFGTGLLILAAFLVLVRSPEEAEPQSCGTASRIRTQEGHPGTECPGTAMKNQSLSVTWIFTRRSGSASSKTTVSLTRRMTSFCMGPLPLPFPMLPRR